MSAERPISKFKKFALTAGSGLAAVVVACGGGGEEKPAISTSSPVIEPAISPTVTISPTVAPTPERILTPEAVSPVDRLTDYVKSILKPKYAEGNLDVLIQTVSGRDYDVYLATKYFDNAIIVANYSVGKGGQFAKDVPIEINVLIFETTGKDSKDLTSQSILSMMNEYFNIPAGLTPDSWKKSTAGGNTVYEIVQDNANTTKDTRTAWLAAWKYIDKDGKIVGGTYQLRACLIFPASPGYKGGTCTAGF